MDILQNLALTNLPQAVEVEKDLLGTLLLKPAALDDIDAMVTPATFNIVQHRNIYRAIKEMHAGKTPCDIHTLVEYMRSKPNYKNDADPIYIAGLLDDTSVMTTPTEKAQILRQLEMKRALLGMAYGIARTAKDATSDVQEIFESIEKDITTMQMGTATSTFQMSVVSMELWDYLKRMAAGGDAPISTGLRGLDDLLAGGFRSPELIIIGGRPSMGKTQFAIHFAEKAAQQDKTVLFVSIEQTRIQLAARMAAKGVSYTNMRTGQMSDAEWKLAETNISDMMNYKIHVADDADCRFLSNIKSMARRLKRTAKLDMLIIDYLQLVRTNMRFERRYIEVGYITGELKALAKELQIPILLLAQLSRPEKGTKAKLPTMEDLRESGDIEQDADIIIFPHRPSYYDSAATDNNGRSWQDRGILLVAKNREGVRNAETAFKNDSYFKQFWDDDDIITNKPF